MKNLISVIVPVFNVENYLPRCIDSIIRQTYDNIEVILVNDGSTDGSLMICKEYSKIDKRIVLIDKQNGGLSDARNVGIDRARGEYVCFIDSDDYIHVDYLMKMYEAIRRDESDICVCNFKSVIEDESFADKQYGAKLTSAKYYSKDVNSLFLSDKNISMVVAWNKLYKTNLFRDIRYPLNRIHEDEWTTYKILYKCNCISTIEDDLYYYVQRINSITYSKKPKNNIFDVFDACYQRYYFGKQYKNKALSYDSINRCIWQLKHIVETNDYGVVGAKVKRKAFKILFKCPLYFRQYVSKLKLLRKIILESAKYRRCFKKIKRINNFSKRQIQHFIMLGTPTHNNLGDHAIVVAEKEFFKKIGISGNHIIEFQTDSFYQYAERIYSSISIYSVAVIDGGGNLGSFWPNEHKRILEILSNVSRGKIIMFPETIFYNDRDMQSKFFAKDLDTLLNANCLFMLRDNYSYSFFNRFLSSTKHIFVPDIVFSLKDNRFSKVKANKKVLFIFRNDKEKVVVSEDVDSLKRELENRGFVVEETSTISKKSHISSRGRLKEIKLLFKKISKSKLVVTDRLHGMIFSYINNTKCYALNNANSKVEGSFYWISNNSNYKVSDHIDLNSVMNLLNDNHELKDTKIDFAQMRLAVEEWIRIRQ